MNTLALRFFGKILEDKIDSKHWRQIYTETFPDQTQKDAWIQFYISFWKPN